jgi:hypothetical protein
MEGVVLFATEGIYMTSFVSQCLSIFFGSVISQHLLLKILVNATINSFMFLTLWCHWRTLVLKKRAMAPPTKLLPPTHNTLR